MIRTTCSPRFLEQGHGGGGGGGGMRQWRSAEGVGVEELGVHLFVGPPDGYGFSILSSVVPVSAAKSTATLRGSGVIGKLLLGFKPRLGLLVLSAFVGKS